MRQFLKFMFASMLGTLLIGILLIVLFIGSLAALGSAFGADKQAQAVKDGSVLHIKLDQAIADQGPDHSFNFDMGPFAGTTRMGLNDILKDLDKAKRDDRIKGIFLDLTYVSAGTATLKEIRDKVVDFKSTSGKPVVAYAEMYTQGTYYLASAADEVYLTPEGDLDFRGLRSESMYMKGLFDKLGVDVQFIRGSNNQFKSFGETLVQDHMSEANRKQISALLAGIWNAYLDDIGTARKLDRARLNTIADSLLVRSAQDAVHTGMIDGAKYRDEVLAHLKERTGAAADKDIPFVELSDYNRAYVKRPEAAANSKDRVAVVFAEGDIITGESADGSMGSSTISEAIREAREDSTVKAIVLRVNSPGGSGLASDIIWREVELARQAKPVVVSMGDVAASGGYYIACAADRIWAEPNTITGSIGVFGIIPNMQGFFNDKLGITFDGVQTHKFSGMFTTSRPLTAEEKGIIQGLVDRFYDNFKQRVADGRKLTVAQVDSIGQGRVWTGVDAQRIGLVDELGGLEAAIADAAQRAGLEKDAYRLKELPAAKNMFTELMQQFGAGAKAWAVEQTLGEDLLMVRQLERVRQARNMVGLQARMPFDLELH